ncbi:hypothetical protein [Streptomyces sp. NPDC006645]|uniref:hypothetical protein n=1 Tax=unclassified Streptomyces TaxID=2593676 RepID=UPI0033A41BCC
MIGPGATPAAAAADCNTWVSNSAPYTGYAKCTGMTVLDRFRVKVICIDSRGTKTTMFGPMKKNAQTSSKKCSDNPNVGVYQVGSEVWRI